MSYRNNISANSGYSCDDVIVSPAAVRSLGDLLNALEWWRDGFFFGAMLQQIIDRYDQVPPHSAYEADQHNPYYATFCQSLVLPPTCQPPPPPPVLYEPPPPPVMFEPPPQTSYLDQTREYHRYVPPRAGATKYARTYDSDVTKHTPVDGEYYNLDPPTFQRAAPISGARAARMDVIDPRRTEARDIFREFDVQHTGYISLDEFLAILGDLDHNVSIPEAKQMYPIWKNNPASLMPENDFVTIFCQYF